MIIGIFNDVVNWEKIVLKHHKDANHSTHKLSLMADIGISAWEQEIQLAIQTINAEHSYKQKWE